jgi:GPH family glycoside/pentoside/hexuronide:cation symporter
MFEPVRRGFRMINANAPAAPADAPDQDEKLPLATKLAFGAGDLSPGIATIILGFFQLFFLTTVAGLSPGLAGTILFVAKAWDAVTDPLMGWITDHTRSRHGRRRPWLLYGAVPFGLIFFLQWIVPPFGQTGTFLYYLLMVILMSTAFTIVSVPYVSLTPELSPNYNERTSLNSFRFAFSIGGSIIFGALFPAIANAFDSNQTGYMVAGAATGLICVFPFLWCFFGVRERYASEQSSAMALPIPQQLRIVFRNRPFLFVIGIYLCSWLAVQITSTVLSFYITYWLRREDLFPVMILAVQGSALVFLFVWGAVANRIGKKAVYLIGMLFWVGVQAMLFFLQRDQTTLAIVLAVLAGVGVATAYLIPWSMMPDVIEFDELQTGQRREGIFYGFMVFLQKVGLALGLFLVGQGLEWQGFDQNLPVGEQSESALFAIRLMIGPMPAILLVLGMVLAAFYPISRQKHAEMRAQLAARQQREP